MLVSFFVVYFVTLVSVSYYKFIKNPANPGSMVTFPNCKINLGLNITGRRNDGYHDLESVFYPLYVKDIVEIIVTKNDFQFSISGPTLDGRQEDNLCVKAYTILKKDFPQLPPVQMHLHKVIPIGAGLGGGSADGAFTLKLLDQKFALGLSAEQLINYASQLGSDCPFFIINQPCYATGRGEVLEKIELDLSGYKFLIVASGIHINTKWAFSLPGLPDKPVNKEKLKEIIFQPVETWKNKLTNDFEKVIFPKHPEIRLIKEKLYEAGALYASMSGSGSAVYGIFKKEVLVDISFPNNYFIKEVNG
jgi:4-diphosphocytidyl-2-C-methyl-D-erythritol kinase